MTIAVGFLCSDGIVISADRKLSGGNYTYPECKLTGVKWGNGRGVTAYTGLRSTHIAFDKALADLLQSDQDYSPDDVENRLRQALSFSVPPKEQFEVLFGFWQEGSPCPSLLNAEIRPSGKTVITPVDQCEVIGADTPLTRFLRNNVLRSWHTMTMQQAMMHTVRIISTVCEFDGQWTGNGADMRTISSHQDTGNIRIGVQGGLESIEGQIALMDLWYGNLFQAMTNSDHPLDITQFLDAIRRFRTFTCGSPIIKPLDS